MRRPSPAKTRRAADQIGEHVLAWRKLQGLTADQVSQRAGISHPTLRKVENGSRNDEIEAIMLDVRDVYPDERELSMTETEFGAENFLLLEGTDNWELAGDFTLHVLSPKPPYSAKTGWVTLNYSYGSGSASTSKPYNGFTQGLIDKARDVPTDDIASDVLLAMLEPDEAS